MVVTVNSTFPESTFGSSGSVFSFLTRLFGVRTHLTRFNPRSNPIITFLALPGVDACKVLKKILYISGYYISLLYYSHILIHY